MRATLELPVQYARWLKPRPWLEVKANTKPAVVFNGVRHPLHLHLLPQAGRAALMRISSDLGPTPGAVVVCSLLPALARSDLEERGVGYLDSRGHLHIVTPTGIIHVEGTPAPRREVSSTIGVRGVRLVQELLARDQPFTVSALAKDLALSLALTHDVLALLLREGLLNTRSAGATRWRSVGDRTRLLDWLEAQPVARRREPHLDLAVYGRHPADLWAKMATRLQGAGIVHALTGGAAAALHGSGPTSVATSLIRIDPQVPLETAAAALGASVAERGSNVRLLRDTGQVGTIMTELVNGVPVAPRVRVYLDGLTERRGADVARQFREAILGY